MHERLLLLRKTLHLSQEIFSKKIGLSQTGYSTIERKKSSVTEQTIITVCKVFNVNENWLRYGQGQMFNTIDKQYNEFFSIYNKLNKPLQDFLFKVSKDLLDTQNRL